MISRPNWWKFLFRHSTFIQLDGSKRFTNKSHKRRAREVFGESGAEPWETDRGCISFESFFFFLRTFTLPTTNPRIIVSLGLIAAPRYALENGVRIAAECLAFATKTCQIAAFVRGIIGLIILSRTHAYPRGRYGARERTLCARMSLCYLPSRSLPVERVRGVISFGAIKGPTTLIPAGIFGIAERRNTIPA